MDHHGVGADPLDRRAKRDEETGQILHVRLAGRVAQDRGPVGGDRGHQRVLGPRHAGFVEEDVGAPESTGTELVAVGGRDLGTQLFEGQEVGVHAPPPDHVASRGRQHNMPAPGEEGPGQEDRRPDVRAEPRVEFPGLDVSRLDLQRIGAGPVRSGANGPDELDHGLGIADSRNVLSTTRSRVRARQR